jgi:splicing factor 3A subunit 1
MPLPSISVTNPTAIQQQSAANTTLQTNLSKLTLSAKAQESQSRIVEQIIIPKEPPPDFEFIVDAPSISPQDVDVIKLVAQFVARNGNPFRNSLMNKEQRNPMFDFLKPQHSHFTYFTRLVEQYTRVLLPPRDIVEKLKKEIENPYNILKDLAYRVEWEKIQQREKAKLDELAEKERVAYAQVDWHDFVVVETVDYQPNEIGNFPPPTTPQDVGARIIALERIESDNIDGSVIDYNSRLLMNRIIDDEARVELSTLSKNMIESMCYIKIYSLLTFL